MTTEKSCYFIHTPTSGELYGGQPMSLFYALAVLIDDVDRGKLPGLTRAMLHVRNHIDMDELVAAQPRIVGFSNSTYSRAVADRAARELRRRSPDTIIVYGGPHEDGVFDEYRHDRAAQQRHFPADVDVIVSGDGEYILRELVKIVYRDHVSRAALGAHLHAHATDLASQRGHYAVLLRDGDAIHEVPSMLRTCKTFRRIGDYRIKLDALPFPPRELLPDQSAYQFDIFTDERGRRLKTAQVKTYRGCYFAVNPSNACSFCAVANKFVPASVDRTVAELEQLRAQGYEAVFFDDGTFTVTSAKRKRELEAISDALDRLGFKAAGCQTRADFLDEEILHIMTRGGRFPWYVSIGVESTEQGILDSIGKLQSKANVERAFAMLRDYNVRVGAYLLFGAPGRDHWTLETPESVAATIGFIHEQMTERDVPIISVLPGLMCYLPNTKDSMSYQQSSLQPFRPMIYESIHRGAPWDQLEGGMGFHAAGITEALVQYILDTGRRLLGDVWVDQLVEYVPEPHTSVYAGANLTEPGEERHIDALVSV